MKHLLLIYLKKRRVCIKLFLHMVAYMICFCISKRSSKDFKGEEEGKKTSVKGPATVYFIRKNKAETGGP